MERIDITGQRFGRLLVLSYAGSRKGRAMWLCRCDCGAEKEIAGKSLRTGPTRSCGCLAADVAVAKFRTHGESRGSPEFVSWCAMKARCYMPGASGYPNYGGRGISVCDRWLSKGGFENFLADMGRKPSKTHSLDRIDPNGNYEPGNCRWATRSEQSNNRRPRVKCNRGHPWTADNLVPHGDHVTCKTCKMLYRVRKNELRRLRRVS